MAIINIEYDNNFKAKQKYGASIVQYSKNVRLSQYTNEKIRQFFKKHLTVRVWATIMINKLTRCKCNVTQ